MSRLGDLIQRERLRRKLSAKEVARQNGLSEKYLLEVESGKRIIADDQARRILRGMGLSDHNEADFSLDEIAATVDLTTLHPRPVAIQKENQKENQKIALSEDKAESGIWLDALAGVLKAVPIYNAVWKVVRRRLAPIQNGRIEGGAPDKVFYFLVPDESMSGFRMRAGDLALMLPSASPIDESIMLVETGNQRMLRKVKILNNSQVLLQSFDREYMAETYALADLHFLGRAVRIEIALP